MNKKRKLLSSDNTGIASAILCTVHCLLIPALFLIKLWWANNSNIAILPSWWSKLDYAFLAISFWAVYHSTAHTSIKIIKIFLWLFWTMLAIAILFENWLHWLAYIASAGLVLTHLRNIAYIKNQKRIIPQR